MKQKKNTPRLTGEQAFELYYGELYADRWPLLKAALGEDNVYARLSWGKESYFLDPASLTAALCLDVTKASSLLDMCAAPGGKSLVISGIKSPSASLNSNERSPARKARLDKVIETVLPEEISSTVITSLGDAALWCKRQEEAFDAILLDAPCSSERHVLADPKYLKDWTPSRVKTLSMEQWALMSSAWRLLKKGGFLLYATCALSHDENDGRVEKLLKKFDDVNICSPDYVKEVLKGNLNNFTADVSWDSQEFSLDPLTMFSLALKTEYGFHILPDAAKGAGPLYFTLLQKKY
ncbi:RsmB/NOP family class I SAM-dependent RNA methyltransferase [Treponema sp.]|uniref:RsmB/NOP family class I SAM-dependent RNA methyltransferase n=1 Tax=Treponema sp. TaxID=166 RepID=UPI0025FEA58B|nr:RsmB/NOP family class I SAM-dependent RNA methyltransferase [Treponema sp.]MCR5218239.1 RsmB/NOP family class I SAM-dependent RNA methyltransferase [Treponema sp.]